MPAKICVASLAVTMTVWASTASAQVETFVYAVAQLAQATAQPPDARAAAIRAATNRMANALAEWDSGIATVKRYSERHVDRGVAYAYAAASRTHYANSMRPSPSVPMPRTSN